MTRRAAAAGGGEPLGAAAELGELRRRRLELAGLAGATHASAGRDGAGRARLLSLMRDLETGAGNMRYKLGRLSSAIGALEAAWQSDADRLLLPPTGERSSAQLVRGVLRALTPPPCAAQSLRDARASVACQPAATEMDLTASGVPLARVGGPICDAAVAARPVAGVVRPTLRRDTLLHTRLSEGEHSARSLPSAATSRTERDRYPTERAGPDAGGLAALGRCPEQHDASRAYVASSAR